MDKDDEKLLRYVKDATEGVVALDTITNPSYLSVSNAKGRAYKLASLGYLELITYRNFPAFLITVKGNRYFWSFKKRTAAWLVENWPLAVTTVASLVAAITGVLSLWSK